MVFHSSVKQPHRRIHLADKVQLIYLIPVKSNHHNHEKAYVQLILCYPLEV